MRAGLNNVQSASSWSLPLATSLLLGILLGVVLGGGVRLAQTPDGEDDAMVGAFYNLVLLLLLPASVILLALLTRSYGRAITCTIMCGFCVPLAAAPLVITDPEALMGWGIMLGMTMTFCVPYAALSALVVRIAQAVQRVRTGQRQV